MSRRSSLTHRRVLSLQLIKNLTRPGKHRRRHSGKSGYVNTVALIGSAWHNPVHENDFTVLIIHRNIRIPQRRTAFLKIHKLMIVRCKHGPAAAVIV